MVDLPNTPDPAPSARELLAFYLESGVDCALGDEPVNRLVDEADPVAGPRTSELRQAASKTPMPIPPARPAAPAADPAPSPDVAIAAAREAARVAPTLEALRAIVEGFEGCALRATAMRTVFSDGNPQARVMFVGEAPGRDEDIQGLPFVGRSGKLLDLMMAAIGLTRESVYIANIIPWRPPGNRDPSPQETQICLPFIKRQIELVNPDVLVCLGKPSSHAVLNLTDGITRIRGRWRDYETGTRTIKAMPTFHPAYLLRQPSGKGLVWQDLRAIQKMLANS